MTKFLFNSLIFSFLFVASNLFGDSITTVKSPDRFTVLSKIITTDKYSTFRVILTGPFYGGYGYDSSVSILINGKSSNYSYGNGNPSLRESGGIDKTFVIPPGLINAAFAIAEQNSGATYTYDLILINSCPSTAECSSITCPYCNTVYCRVHSQHYSITFKSDHCKINMHTFCTDNQAAANEYNSAQKTATCSLCNASYCKLCGHTCGSLNEGCPNLQDCLPKSCATCKSTYCETHSFHLCSPVGNNNNNSGGSWSVWTEQVGTTENVNVQADFTPLVNAQNTANTLLNNIKSSLPGFVTDINNTINDGVNSITSSLSGIDSNTSSIASDTSIIADNSTSIANNFDKLLKDSSSVITKLTDINTLFSTSNKTLTDQLETQNSINVKLTASNASLTSINTLAKLINTDVSKLKSILSDEIVVGLAHHLVELKKQTNLSEKDAVIQNAIKDFLENNVHPALKDTKTFQDLISSDLTLLLADLENLRTNSDSIIEHITYLKDNSDHKKSILENLLNNSNFMRLDVSSIKSNTDDIKNKTDDIKNNTDSIKSDVASTKLNTDAIKDLTAGIKSTADGIKSTADGLKSTADGIKSTADGINDKLTAQGKTLDDINSALSPSAPSNRIQNVDFVPVTPETKYEQKHGPISPDHNLSTDKVKQKSEDFKSKFENLPKITAPNYKPLVLNFPLSTDFYDFSFNLDLNGGPYAGTIASAKSLSYSIFSCFWVLTFCFLFIKSLRQW